MFSKQTPDWIDSLGQHFYLPNPDNEEYGYGWAEWCGLTEKQRYKIRKKGKKDYRMNMEDFMKAKQVLKKAIVPVEGVSIKDDYAYMYSLPVHHSLVPLSYGTPEPCKPVNTCKEKKEKKMYNLDIDCEYNSAPNPELVQRDYLVGRLHSANMSKHYEGRKTFNMDPDLAPTTMNDLVQRIKDGKYVIKEDRGDKFSWNPAEQLEWKDPSKKKDEAGFKAFEKLLETATTKAKDQIMISTTADGLKALQDFESSTIQ